MSRDSYFSEVSARFRLRREEMSELLRELEKMKQVKKDGQRRIRIL
jgi:hypothetical protein